MRFSLSRAVALCALVGLPCAASASVVSIISNSAGSTEMLGAFNGTLSYTGNTATTGTLTISLTNTSAPANGGYITGLVFDVPGDASGVAALTSANPLSFANTGSEESASPFGTFDAGAALGGSFLGGGSPTGGIAIGSTGTFVFAITSPSASSLDADDFITLSGKPGLLVRFRGFANGGSDKVPGTIPAPSAAALLGLGVMCVARRRR